MALLSSYPHKLMEKRHRSNTGLEILELGAGEMEHIPWVSSDFSSYTATDLNFDRLKSAPFHKNVKVSIKEQNAELLGFDDNSFDRIIATCLLAHLQKPEEALMEWRRVTRPGGKLTVYVPCEPGLALRTFRRLISARNARRLGFNGFELCIARDHINDYWRLSRFIKEVFNQDSIVRIHRPFLLPGGYLNLFVVFEIQKT